MDRKEETVDKAVMLNNDPPGRLEVEEFKRRMAMTRKQEELQAEKEIKDTETGILIPRK